MLRLRAEFRVVHRREPRLRGLGGGRAGRLALRGLPRQRDGAGRRPRPEDTLHNVTVRYRTDTGGTYFGGLSYTATVEELAPGASQTVLAAECYMGLPSVIAVSADES